MITVFKRGRTYWIYTRKNGIRIRKSLKTESYAEAQIFAKKLDQELDTQSPKTSSIVAKDRYIETVRPRVSPAYVSDIKYRLDRICLDCPNLSDITASAIESYLQETKSQYDYNNALSTIKAWLRWCVKSGMLSKCHADNIKKIHIQDKARRSFTVEEVAKIIQTAKNETIYPLVMIAIYTGMRKSELLRLDWEDINLKNRIITVNISKSKKIRILPISDALYKVLRPLKHESGPICDLHNHRRIIGRIFRKAGIDGGWHHFRHTFITTTLQTGTDIETTRELAGHSSISVTAKYLHSTPKHLAEAVNRLNFVHKTVHNKKAPCNRKRLSRR
jgi:integrase